MGSNSYDYDFSGWATRNNLKCSDGRVIMRDAFKDNDGTEVPLVWNHQHNEVSNVLGHALLENRPDGVYAYCKFNDTESGRNAKALVEHGDVNALSIYANKLKQQNGNVNHGTIREVSLVLAGANPGAFIDSIVRHGDTTDEEAIIYTDESIELYHSDEAAKKDLEPAIEHAEETEKADETPQEDKKVADNRTIKDVFDEMTEEQKNVVYAMIGMALEDAGVSGDQEEEEEDMKHNVFDADEDVYMGRNDVLSHSEMESIITDAKRYGSLKDSVLRHGIDDIEYLFPDAQSLDNPPAWIKRPDEWVDVVMGDVHHTPFSRIKSMFADITEDEARAKGYIKGHLKKEEVFSLLKRTTTPTTVYKKQKLDRDDVVDITDFDVVAWLKTEMRFMLDEEIARAILIGDGRLPSSDDKINELNIRPIVSDADLFTIKYVMANDSPKTIIQSAVRARKDYRGSGRPTLFTTEAYLTEMLLLEDLNQRVIYDTEEKLATAMRVDEIVTVPPMENLTIEYDPTEVTVTDRAAVKALDGNYKIVGIIVNMQDYNVGADKGGAVNMFDDFDIDYNAQKYLIETRCSGALTKPFSAIVLVVPAGEQDPSEA